MGILKWKEFGKVEIGEQRKKYSPFCSDSWREATSVPCLVHTEERGQGQQQRSPEASVDTVCCSRTIWQMLTDTGL